MWCKQPNHSTFLCGTIPWDVEKEVFKAKTICRWCVTKELPTLGTHICKIKVNDGKIRKKDDLICKTCDRNCYRFCTCPEKYEELNRLEMKIRNRFRKNTPRTGNSVTDTSIHRKVEILNYSAANGVDSPSGSGDRAWACFRT